MLTKVPILLLWFSQIDPRRRLWGSFDSDLAATRRSHSLCHAGSRCSGHFPPDYRASYDPTGDNRACVGLPGSFVCD
jgi:hypothetical protein